jgi:hypothetical protein
MWVTEYFNKNNYNYVLEVKSYQSVICDFNIY